MAPINNSLIASQISDDEWRIDFSHPQKIDTNLWLQLGTHNMKVLTIRKKNSSGGFGFLTGIQGKKFILLHWFRGYLAHGLKQEIYDDLEAQMKI